MQLQVSGGQSWSNLLIEHLFTTSFVLLGSRLRAGETGHTSSSSVSIGRVNICFSSLRVTAFKTDVLKKTDLFPTGENPLRKLHDSNPSQGVGGGVFFSCLFFTPFFCKVGVLSPESPPVADLMWCDIENVSGWGGMTALVVRTV